MKKRKIPVWLKVILIILVIIIFISIFDSNNPSENNVNKNNNQTTNENIPASNTSEMVDYLVRKAKNESNDSLKNEAIQFIKNNIDNLFKNNKTMEDAIYYGSILEYSYPANSTESNIGQDLVQATKYVYRGAESVTDNSTKENIEQIKKNLNKLN